MLPGLDIVPVNTTVLLVVVPLDIVNVGFGVGVGVGDGAPVILVCALAPMAFTALTRKVCVAFDSPVKVWERPDEFCAVVHPPLLRATSYLIIGAPPLFVGVDQLRVTWLAPGVTLRLWGAVGTVPGVTNVC